MRTLVRVAARTLLAIAAAFAIAACAPGTVGKTPRVFIGTYTTGESLGIYTVEFDSETGRFRSDPQLAVETTNPSFLALHPDGRTLYAVNELPQFQGAATGAVSAFEVDRDSGRLTLLNQEASEGADPCFVLI